MKTILNKRMVTLGMASLMAVGVLTGCATPNKVTEVPVPQTGMEKPSTSPQLTSPMGDRKMIDIEGNRYAFLNNGQVFELGEEQLGDEVAKQNEGTLFELKGFNKAFRMAFKYDNAFYIVENVGKSDDSAIDLQAYLEAADLKTHVMYGDIFDIFGANILNSLDKEASDKVLDMLGQAQIVELTTEEHEAIAKAQAEGLTYLVEFTLDDYTTFSTYITPSMNYVTIGDYTCLVEGLENEVGSYFENLEINEGVIMN